MHELGVLHRILAAVGEAAAANGVSRIRAVRLRVGALSGLVPDFLRRYYGAASADDPLFRGSALEIETVPGRGLCRACGTGYPATADAWKCPACGGADVGLEGGRELVVENILAETGRKRTGETVMIHLLWISYLQKE